jgi:hypothetical protein
MRRLFVGSVLLCVLGSLGFGCGGDEGPKLRDRESNSWNVDEPGKFGDACDADDDCSSGLCVVAGGEGFCSVPCEESCEQEGYVCFDEVCVPQDFCNDAQAGPGCVEPGCASECSEFATCVDNGEAGYACVCNEGYEGDGATCAAIDFCATDNGGCGDERYVACTDGLGQTPSCVALDVCSSDNGGCGDERYFGCSEGLGQAPTCAAIDVCSSDNGGCGDSQYFVCSDGVGQAPTCTPIDQCATDNGGCGPFEFFVCTNGLGQAPTCTAIDLCLYFNGGCGDEQFFACTNGVGRAPTCSAIDLCQTDNGGCGDSRYFACRDGLGQTPTCAAIDLCQTDNGGCGDPQDYECSHGLGQEPLCRFVGLCYHAQTFVAEANASISMFAPDSRETENLRVNQLDTRRTLVRFDLDSWPMDYGVDRVRFEMTAFNGWAHGGDGNVYTHLVDDAWSEETVSWNNQPALKLQGHLGFWWIWYGGGTYDQLGSNGSPALIEPVNAALGDNGQISFRISSPGYDTVYYNRHTADRGRRPRLVVEGSRCQVADITATQNAMVSSSNPSTALGGASLVVDRFLSEVYLKFDLSSLPPDAIVTSVRLQMKTGSGYAWGGDGNVYTRFVENDSWTEANLTWNNRPEAISDPLGYWWIWYDSGIFIDYDAINEDPRLIPLIQREAAGDKTVSLRLHSPGYRTNYYNRLATDRTFRPRLIITYELLP